MTGWSVAVFVVTFAAGTFGTAVLVGRFRACAYPCPDCHVGPWETCVTRRKRLPRPGRAPHRGRRRLVRRRFFEMAGWMLLEFAVVGAACGAAWAVGR